LILWLGCLSSLQYRLEQHGLFEQQSRSIPNHKSYEGKSCTFLGASGSSSSSSSSTLAFAGAAFFGLALEAAGAFFFDFPSSFLSGSVASELPFFPWSLVLYNRSVFYSNKKMRTS
jgi:hypothetical protein